MATSFKPTSVISGPAHFGGAGQIFGCSQQGFSHCYQCKSCQDSHAIEIHPQCLTVAIADGHGDSRYRYSDVGSQLAVQQAVLTATQAIDSHDWLTDIFPRWHLAVQQYAHLQNISEELTLYGTTLQVIHLQEGILSGAQIGDGSLWLLTPDQSATCLLQSTEELGGFTTRSLGSIHDLAYGQSFQQIIPAPGSLLVMTTDGLTDSFENQAEWQHFLASLRERVHTYGFQEVCAALPEWLQHYSTEGCGDDMTVVLVQIG